MQILYKQGFYDNHMVIDSHGSQGKLKILTDVPFRKDLNYQLEDALNFGRYSNAISEIITNSDPRFAVGIFGGWGTGKTTLMHMIKNNLDRNDSIITLWFEAWRYEREDNLAVIPFLRTFKLRLDEINESSKGSWINQVKEGVIKSVRAFLEGTEISAGIPGIVTVKTNVGEIVRTKDVIGIDNAINTVYYHGIVYLQEALKAVRSSDESRRIVVFIDDLDRCFPEKALEVLESVKSLFDIDGIVFVIAMDSNSIDNYVKNKYGQNTQVKGIDYLQKIVQLPFQVPTWDEGWNEDDVFESVQNIISLELKNYPRLAEITKNIKLIVKGVQLNPREIKRFINSIILAESVFSPGKANLTIDELITVQALSFRNDWKNFLDIITPNDTRKLLFDHYKEFRKGDNFETLLPSLEDVLSEESQKGNDFFHKLNEVYDHINPSSEVKTSDTGRASDYRNELKEFYIEYIKLGEELRSFLNSGADIILSNLKDMGIYRRALQATKHTPVLDFEIMDSCWRDPKKDKKFKREMYQFHAIIFASNSILDQIEYVTYRLPPSWKELANQTKTDKDRYTNFKLKELAWGSFTLYVDVKFKGQSDLITKSHRITIRDESPRLPV